MGVKTTLAGVTFTATGKSQAETIGCDIAGTYAEAQNKIIEAIVLLNFLVADVLTPAGTESANITTINAQITALS